MNDLTAKKLGEVQAFLLLAAKLESKSAVAVRIYSPAFFKNAAEYASKIEDAVTGEEGYDVFSKKTAKTLKKLNEMMDIYVHKEWDNPLELLEWGGFYFGGALVHVALICGLLKAEPQPPLNNYAKKLDVFFAKALDDSMIKLQKIRVKK